MFDAHSLQRLVKAPSVKGSVHPTGKGKASIETSSAKELPLEDVMEKSFITSENLIRMATPSSTKDATSSRKVVDEQVNTDPVRRPSVVARSSTSSTSSSENMAILKDVILAYNSFMDF